MDSLDQNAHPLHGRTILLAEDNEDEIFMMQRAFKKAQIDAQLLSVRDGDQAVAYLEGIEGYSDRTAFPMPSVIFLDLNMPKKGGLEVLEYMRSTEKFRKIIVNVLSSSTRVSDIEQAAFSGANAYFVKPSQIEKFQEMMTHWYALARFEAFPR